MMRQRGHRRSGFYAALAAVVAFVTFVLYEASHLVLSVNDALLSMEIFRKQIPLATPIAAVIVGGCVVGLGWFHKHELAIFWKKISGHLKIRLPSLRYVVRAVSLAGLLTLTIFLVSVFVLTLIRFPDANFKLQVALTGPSQQLYLPNSTPRWTPDPTSSESKPSPDPPGPRMAGRHVCELFEDPTDDEYNACMIYIDRHPGLKGTGGPVCILVEKRIKCFRWSPPSTKLGPPLKISPHKN